MQTPFSFMRRACILSLSLLLPALAAAATDPPNVILITLDTVRADRMGFLGSKQGLTPQLDALALQGVVFDRPQVAEQAAKEIEAVGLSDRCRAVAGDFFKEVTGGGDAYLLKYILHDWDDANCERILSSCRRAIAPSGKLLAIETVVPPPGVSGHSKLDDIEMMVLLGSQERTEEEYTMLLERSGFRLTRVVPVNWLLSVIEAEPL